MTFEQIRLAIESRLAAWPDAPIAFDNVPNGPTLQAAIDGKQPWVRLTLVPGDTMTVAIGDGPKARHSGLIMLQVFTPERTGSTQAMQLADSLAQHIQYWQQGGLETQAASLARVGSQNGWFQINISAPYRAD